MTLSITRKAGASGLAGSAIMKKQDSYLHFVLWSDEDAAYVGYCPDLFPAGGVCHGATPVEAYARLYEIVEDTVQTAESQGLALPEPRTRPMREVETA
jgi:predicted RNase H-like HicB family nuclease